MEMEKFERFAIEKCTTQVENENMMHNTLNKNKPEFADIALEVLNKMVGMQISILVMNKNSKFCVE